jgi:hypothetical protein
MYLGEGQADQTSKYLGLRIIRSLGKLPSSMEKISLYGVWDVWSLYLGGAVLNLSTLANLPFWGGHSQMDFHHRKRDAYTKELFHWQMHHFFDNWAIVAWIERNWCFVLNAAGSRLDAIFLTALHEREHSVDLSQLSFKFALLIGAVLLVMIFYFFLRALFLGKCPRCGHRRYMGAKFCINCGHQYE